MYEAQLEDGTKVSVDKFFEGDVVVLKDADGNRYDQAPTGAHIVPISEGETAKTEAETDTEPVEEETEETAPEASEEDDNGGATEEPIG